MDQIQIKDLECYCHHGVLKEENVLGQKFLVSATMYCDTKKAGLTDELAYSVNYAEAAHLIYEHMQEKSIPIIGNDSGKTGRPSAACLSVSGTSGHFGEKAVGSYFAAT